MIQTAHCVSNLIFISWREKKKVLGLISHIYPWASKLNEMLILHYIMQGFSHVLHEVFSGCLSLFTPPLERYFYFVTCTILFNQTPWRSLNVQTKPVGENNFFYKICCCLLLTGILFCNLHSSRSFAAIFTSSANSQVLGGTYGKIYELSQCCIWFGTREECRVNHLPLQGPIMRQTLFCVNFLKPFYI